MTGIDRGIELGPQAKVSITATAKPDRTRNQSTALEWKQSYHRDQGRPVRPSPWRRSTSVTRKPIEEPKRNRPTWRWPVCPERHPTCRVQPAPSSSTTSNAASTSMPVAIGQVLSETDSSPRACGCRRPPESAARRRRPLGVNAEPGKHLDAKQVPASKCSLRRVGKPRKCSRRARRLKLFRPDDTSHQRTARGDMEGSRSSSVRPDRLAQRPAGRRPD